MNYLQKNTIVSFVAAAALHLLVPSAMAQTPLPQESELGSVEQEITSSAANLEKIRAEIAAAIKDQEQVSDRLIAIAKTIQSQEAAITAAIDEGAPAPVLSAALFQRFASRGEEDFANKVLSAMRFQFGGHIERATGG